MGHLRYQEWRRHMKTTATFGAMHAPEMQHGVCVICRGTLAEHFKGEEWIGCQRRPRGMRGSTALFVPFIVVGSDAVRTAAETPGVPERRRRARRATETPEVPVTTTRGRTRTETTPETKPETPRGRGRAAGVYTLAKNAPAESDLKLTDSIRAVYKQIKQHKRGISVKDLAAKLDMPSGTVGWAIQKLVRQSAVQYHPPAV